MAAMPQALLSRMQALSGQPYDNASYPLVRHFSSARRRTRNAMFAVKNNKAEARSMTQARQKSPAIALALAACWSVRLCRRPRSDSAAALTVTDAQENTVSTLHCDVRGFIARGFIEQQLTDRTRREAEWRCRLVEDHAVIHLVHGSRQTCQLLNRDQPCGTAHRSKRSGRRAWLLQRRAVRLPWRPAWLANPECCCSTGSAGACRRDELPGRGLCQ